MKKFLYFMLFVAVQSVTAQNTYDVMRLTSNEPAGTARFVGMGGSMAALGTDISVASTNPAGIGLYRSNDATFSLGLQNVQNKADFMGTGTESRKTSFAIDNMGFVFSSRWGDSGLKFFNVAFNYRHSNNFYNSLDIAGSLLGADGKLYSQQYELYELYKQSGDYVDYRDFTSLKYSWLGLLASQSGLIDEQGNLGFVPENNSALFPRYMNYRSQEKGGLDEVDINLSCNVDDMLYLGLTMTASSVDYTKTTEYSEFCDDYDYHTLQNWYNVSGSGFGLKLGAIVRPFENSPFRIGLAFHTPTWYALTDQHSATMLGTKEEYDMSTLDYEAYGEDFLYDYDYTTPWRVNVAAAYTFGSFAAVNAEYEFVDYSTAKLEYTDGFEMRDLNYEIEANMKAQHIFRLGALFNLSENFSLRTGYNYISAPFDCSAAKTELLTFDTSTDYVNSFQTNVFTLGFGYMSNGFYLDFAYKLAMQRADFYNYYDADYLNPAASLDINRHNVVMSLGFRF